MRIGPGGAQSTVIKTKPKVFITDTRDMQLAGACVFFIKINPTKALTLANINQVYKVDHRDTPDHIWKLDFDSAYPIAI